LQTETEDHAEFVVIGTASAYLLFANENQASLGRVRHPGPAGPGFKTSLGGNWVYATKHDGYRMIVRRDGPRMRLYTPMPMTGLRLPATAEAAGIQASRTMLRH
jgi:hypothetical protein